MRNKEGLAIKKIMLMYSANGFKVFRNNTGLYWSGKNFKAQGGIYLQNAIRIQGGLGTGSPDIIGWKSIDITPEMIGEKVAVFVGIEVKTEGIKTTKDQELWLAQLKKDGGVAEILHT
jgi:hypothetical protein